MYIEKRIKLNDINYYIRVEVEYRRENTITCLKLKNFYDDYYDGGNFSDLLEKIEKNYTSLKAQKYDENIGYMADVLYLYERIPFLMGIRDEYISKKDNQPYSIGYITREEIENYIKINNIKLKTNPKFTLNDARTWFI